MAHFLPVGKLVLYLAKSTVKPVSKRIVSFTKDRPGFIRSCQWITDQNHQMYVNIAKWTGNRIPIAERHVKMTKQEAVEFCTDLLGELIIVSAGVGFIVYEYRRGSKHKTQSNATDMMHTQQIYELKETIGDMEQRIGALEKCT